MKKNFLLFLENEYVWSVATKVIVVLFALMEQILFARYLGASLKGNVSYFQNLIMILQIVFSFGLYAIYPLYRKKTLNFSQRDIDIFESGIIVMYICLTIIGSTLVAFHIIQGAYILVMYVSILVAFSDSQSFIYLVEKPNARNSIILLTGVIEAIVYIIVYKFISPSLVVGVLLLFAVEILRGTVFLIILKPHFIFSKVVFNKLLDSFRLGFFPMIALLLTGLNYKLDIIMLSNCHNVASSEVGVYSIAIAIAEKTFLIPDSLKEVLNSKLAKGANKQEVIKIIKYGIYISGTCAVGIFVLCVPVVNFLFGEEYSDAVSLIRITVVFTTFMVFFKMLAAYNISRNKQIVNTFFLVCSVCVNFVCNYWFIPLWGAMGAAIATSVGFVVCGGLFAGYFCITEGENLKRLVFMEKSEIKQLFKKVHL